MGTGGKGTQESTSTSQGKGAGRRAQHSLGEAAEGQAAMEGAWTGSSLWTLDLTVSPRLGLKQKWFGVGTCPPCELI